MNPINHHDRDEARLAELLRAVEPNSPPLDAERLAKLRDLSADAFDSSNRTPQARTPHVSKLPEAIDTPAEDCASGPKGRDSEAQGKATTGSDALGSRAPQTDSPEGAQPPSVAPSGLTISSNENPGRRGSAHADPLCPGLSSSDPSGQSANFNQNSKHHLPHDGKPNEPTRSVETGSVQTQDARASGARFNDSTSIRRSTPMMTLAMRGLAAALASAAIILVSVFLPQPAPKVARADSVPFAEVLAELRGAETLQFHLRRNEGKWNEAEIWVRAPGLVRKESSPQRYEIAAGSRLWRVDEEANTVNETDSPWFLSAEKQIDLVGLLDVEVSDSTPLLRAKPVTKRPTAHGEEFVYLATLPSRIGDVTIEAFADAGTKRLTRMTVWEGKMDFKQWQWLENNEDQLERMPPLADMKLVAMNVPVDDDKFVVAKSLTEDGRIGKVSESQGLVLLRPMLAKRWTPVCRELLLKPGDWLRTELRGANAVKVTLSSEVELTLGPGSLIECMSPTKARLHTGQVKVGHVSNVPVKAKDGHFENVPHGEFTLLAPRDGQRTFKPGDKQLVRVDRDEKLVDVEKTPLWLAGFEGTTNNKSLGSLIVQLPDGRNEPLTVGYHKVNVEIRDQIARTTIEESFVNHTPSRLEGVFHFPLPQDASISGFGMWIGNDLIEADVVEKQRAREIYETILREKRDPGLLEWTGGNIFKARVFPIEAHSEKRVKIVYTQVLPLRANRYRYSYGLRSELLRTKPLRELSLSVTVNSALPLRDVKCTTHPARIATSAVATAEPISRRALAPGSSVVDRSNRTLARAGSEGKDPTDDVSRSPTYHSAQVEFAAQEYTPTRDFEVVCEIDGKQSDVVVVPHRRGDDGYFLVQLTPPLVDGTLRVPNDNGTRSVPATDLQRDVLPDGKPLQLVLLCDTSASMDSDKRKQQSEFVATVLSSLGETDRFQLAVADVGTAWAFAEPVAANAENIAKARAFLDERVSLGWTNLDRAFDDVFKKAPAESHVIYIGDGIVSSGDTDPAAFVKRLAQRSPVGPRQESRTSNDGRSREDGQQKADANSALGKPVAERQGYIHAIGVGNSNESVVLKGIAAVGGGSVRNIGGEQTPQVVAMELLNEITQPGLRDLNVEFRGLRVAAVYPERLPNVAAGTQQILVGRYLPDGKDQVGEIIVTGMRGSEKVKYAARVNLKDAEEGNSFIPRLWARGHLDLLLAQGRSAAIRDEIIRLSEEFHIITPFTSLLVLETDADRERFGVKRRYEMRDGERFFAEGRDNANYELLQQQMKRAADWRIGLRRQVLRELAGLGRSSQAVRGVVVLSDSAHRLSDRNSPMGEPFDSPASYYLDSSEDRPATHDFIRRLSLDISGMGGSGGFRGGMPFGEMDAKSQLELGEFAESLESDELGAIHPGPIAERQKSVEPTIEQLSLGLDAPDEPFPFDVSKKQVYTFDTDNEESYLGVDRREQWAFSPQFSDRGLGAMAGVAASSPARYSSVDLAVLRRLDGFGGFGRRSGGRVTRGWEESANYTAWVNTLFPALAAPPSKIVPPAKQPKDWSPEAIALSKSLLRLDSLRKLDGGIEVRRSSEQTDPRWKRRTSGRRELALYSPTGWLTRPLNLDEQTIVNFCDAKERGVFSAAFLLGRLRESVAQEQQSTPLPLDDFSLTALHDQYPGYAARVEPDGEGRATLVFEQKDAKGAKVWKVGELTIDTTKHVVVKQVWLSGNKPTSTTTFEDFVEIAGTWWAKKLTTTDAKDCTVSITTFEIQALGREPFAARMNAELAAKPSVQFLRVPFVKLAVARQKVADGSAAFDDRLAMILHNASIQQWDELLRHVEAIEKQSLANKPGLRWLRTLSLSTMRRNEEARQRLLAEAKQIVAKPQQDETFLAQFILGQAYPLVGWPEYFEFVQLFEAAVANQPEGASPRFDDGAAIERKPGASAPRLMLQEARLQCLDALGRHEEALALRRELVEKSPWHQHWQTDYANRLARAVQVDAAVAWLRKELARDIEWATHEEDTLRSAICDIFRTHARWADLLKFTTEWIARKPDSWSWNSAYSQHLSALIYNDQLDAANALAEQWFREARIDGELAPDQRARLEVAIQFANGQCYQLSFQHTDERWFDHLAVTIRHFIRHKHHADIGTRGIGNHHFTQSDVADRLRGRFLSWLQTDLANLTPAQVNALLGWTLSGRLELKEPLNGRKQLDASEVPSDVWKSIAAALKPRWLAEKDLNEKHLLSESLRTIYASRFADSELLPFLRERLAAAPRRAPAEDAATTDYRPGYISSLFDRLLVTKWSDDIEKEAFAILLELSDAKESIDRLAVQLPALHRLVDAMLANRQSLAETQLGDQGEQNKLTRKELAAKKAEFRKTAREQLAARLLELAGALLLAKRVPPADDLANWMRIEKAWLDVSLDQNLAQVEELCWQILGEAPPKLMDDSDEELTEPQTKQRLFDALLKQRAFTTAMNLAARRKAEPATIARVLKFIDAGISSPVAPRQEGRTSIDTNGKETAGGNADVNSALGNRVAERHGYDAATHWRHTKYRMLIALDRPDDLERELREWIRADVSTGPWRQSLARLMAERGKLDEAIQLFEACEKDKLLTAADYQLLANWHLVSNRRAAYERSRIEAFKQMPEHHLSNSLYQVRNRWYQTNVPLPSELDENTLFTFRALFEKSAQPENYLWQLREIYGASRDFRLLQMLPDAVLGRSPQQVYSFLTMLQNHVLHELRNEATADEILARIKQLRANDRGIGFQPVVGQKEPQAGSLRHATDLRALDLLEAVVERKSSEVLNQPGPHVAACLAALQRAFDREWGVGEPVMMANFLHQLGSLPNEALKNEQLRELRELQKREPANSRDHLRITLSLAELLFWNYSQKQPGLQLAEAEVAAYAQTNGGTWPHLDNDALARFVSMREGANQHAAGESLLKSFVAKSTTDEQKKWLHDRLMSLYNHALEHDGAVSLGTGRVALFPKLVALNLKELAAAPDENVRYNLVSRIATTFNIAHRHTLPGTVEAVKAFAFETMPPLLKQQQAQYRNTVTAPMHIIGEVLGPKGALQYLVERMEQYPQRLELGWENSWNAFSYELGRRRAESAGAKLDITELEPRVLKLTILELKRELRTGERRNPDISHRSYGHFWSEKEADFAKAAEEVLAERKTSGRRAVNVANYLSDGLDRGARAIEILFVAHQAGLLNESAQVQLVGWLHEKKRWAESIPLLEPLVSQRPDNIHYRTQLMLAYHQSKRPEQLTELVKQTDAHFHQAGRWTDWNIGQFAGGCLRCKLHERAVGYFNEAIALYQRAGNSGLNDSTLSNYYSQLADAHSALGHTKEAVDAASAAIVSWDSHNQHRQHVLDKLKQVLSAAKDLDQYVEHLNAEATKTGQDSPILRKAVGQTYQARKEHAKAIAQLQLAAELQPNDHEIHQALIACFDATQNAAAATKQLLKLIDLQQHNLSLYQQLAERLKDNEAEAERAATSIIESAPNESESHTAMAELRQKQNRWPEAIPHWERVAELRRLEPTGLLKLTEAQLHEKQWDAARKSIGTLQKTEWPARFNDVTERTRRLQEQLPK
jgi:tetratricopeptide (TPR) repeat protein